MVGTGLSASVSLPLLFALANFLGPSPQRAIFCAQSRTLPQGFQQNPGLSGGSAHPEPPLGRGNMPHLLGFYGSLSSHWASSDLCLNGGSASLPRTCVHTHPPFSPRFPCDPEQVSNHPAVFLPPCLSHQKALLFLLRAPARRAFLVPG